MERGCRYRIYPTPEQEVLMAKTFGCVRFVYNWGLDLKSKLYKENKQTISAVSLINKMASELKNEYEWLGEVNSQSLQYALRQLSTAYDNFFKGHNKYPQFKSKLGRQKFNCPQHNRADFKRGLLEIPKFTGKNAIRCVFHRRFQGTIKRVTITKECDGRYYATVLVNDNCEKMPKRPVLEETTLGIDTGLKSFAILSNGETITPPKFSKNVKSRLALLQKALSRKTKGSANFVKAKLKVARLYSKIAHRRQDFIHQLTHRLTHENQVSTICVEDLNIKDMMQNHHLAYSIADASIGEFYRQLQYKCDWYGINFRQIDRFAPSSKTCHVCGYRRPTLALSVRHWVCPQCGANLDRDINAAINIKYFGLGQQTLPAERRKVKPVEKPTMDDRALRLKSSAPLNQEKSHAMLREAAKSSV